MDSLQVEESYTAIEGTRMYMDIEVFVMLKKSARGKEIRINKWNGQWRKGENLISAEHFGT